MRLPSCLDVGRVAIVGGGYAGLLTGLKLAPKSQVIHVYDSCNVGEGGASAVSAGLMHPLNPEGKVILDGVQGFKATKELMESLTSSKPFFKTGCELMREIKLTTDRDYWSAASAKVPEWAHMGWDKKKATMRNAIIVDSPTYLKTLWNNIVEQQPQATWHNEYITDLRALSTEYDTVVLTGGAGSVDLWHSIQTANQQLAIQYVRGQSLLYDVPDINLSHGFFKDQYIFPTVTQPTEGNFTRVICGTTYEYLENYKPERDNKPNLKNIRTAIRDSLCKMLPELQPLQPIGAFAGVRAVPRRTPYGRTPMLGRHPDVPNVWMMTGFGSKGLIYHAMLGNIFANAIIANDETKLPKRYEVRYNLCEFQRILKGQLPMPKKKGKKKKYGTGK